MKKISMIKAKRFLAVLMEVCILSSVNVLADQNQDITERKNIDEYITLNRDIPLLENNQKTGEKEDLRLLFNIPVDEFEDYYFIPYRTNYVTEKEKMCILRFTLHNAKWRDKLNERSDAGDIKYLDKFNDSSDVYYWDLNTKDYGEKDAVNKKDMYISCYLDSMKYYNRDAGNVIDGKEPLLFQVMGEGQVTMDVAVHVGEDLAPMDCKLRNVSLGSGFHYTPKYDPAECSDECFKYIGTITLANIKSNSAQEVHNTTELTTETVTELTTQTTMEQTTEAVTEQTTDPIRNIEISIGQSEYTLNGEKISMDGAAFIKDGYTMLPLRATSKIVGATDKDISYDVSTKTAVINLKDTNVSVRAGDKKINVNGIELPIDSPAVIKDGRMYLPMRAVAEAFGIENISFDGINKVVNIVD